MGVWLYGGTRSLTENIWEKEYICGAGGEVGMS